MNTWNKEIADCLGEIKFNGTICISKDNKIIFEKAMGKADFEKEIANQMSTTFFIASVTKQFTAACILLLVQNGKLNLDDIVSKYVPLYCHAGKITIRNLLNMSSGILDYLNDIVDKQYREEEKESILSQEEFFFYAVDGMNRSYDFRNVMDLVSDLPLIYIPGSKLTYSNTNYQILGYIIEKISGESYQEYVKHNIFEPLQMDSSHLNGLKADADSYISYKNNCRVLGRSKGIGADGSIVSNAYDITKWLQAIVNDKLLSSYSWKQCFTFIKNSDKELLPNNYGFGWMKTDKWYTHGGCQLGYLAGVAIQPEEKISVVVLGNKCSEEYEEEPLYKIIKVIQDIGV